MFDQYGGPEVLKLSTIPLVEPREGEVRIRVQAMSLNRADLLWLANTYVESPRLPARIGYEIAGVVDAVGSNVSEFNIGDRVSSVPAFSISDYGNFAEAVVLPARALIPTPPRLSTAEGASFAFAYFTGYLALFELARLTPYQTVLVTAGTSSTGLAAIAMIRRAGARIIATTRTGKKRDALFKAGAHHVVATEEEDLTQRVMELTGEEGVDIAYDCVAGALSEKIAGSVKVRGHWVVYGLLDTPGAFPWWTVFTRALKFDVYVVFADTGNRNLKLPGDEAAFRRACRFVGTGLADGSLPPVPIYREFKGIESLPDAMRHMLANQAAGKIVITLEGAL
jgi:NADPH:quinone reductase-like Zn-dependent oxidoreductase